MNLSRSAVFKMLQSSAAKDRTISNLPPPFLRQSTPYEKEDFDNDVKNAANSNVILQTGLRLSKLIIIGDVATGKTALVNRFCHQVYDSNYKATIGVDFEVERFDVLDIPFNLQIWDTAGQERFKCIAAAYYRGAHAVMVVFDISDLMTLAHTAQWLEEAKDANQGSSPIVFLVGTKRDLLCEKAYNTVEEQARKVAMGLNAEYWAVSSKTGDNVDQLFIRIAALTFNKAVSEEVKKVNIFRRSIDTIKIGKHLKNSEEKKKTKCISNCSK